MSDAPRTSARVRVPATTANIGPGFDAVGAAVSLHLTAVATPRDGQAERVTSRGEGAGELPGTDENLLWQAFLALCAHTGRPPPDVHVDVTNDVPLERGLGSSSSAIVAGLGLARALLAVDVGDQELVRIAADIEGHPDNVAPAVLGGVVNAAPTDAGALVVRRSQPHARLRPVALVPPTRQATTTARATLPAQLSREDAALQGARAGHVLAGLLGVWPVDAAVAGDRLHEPARGEVMPASARLVGALRDARIHAWLSGAGPTVCAAVPRDDAAALARCGALGEDAGFEVRELDWDLSGLVARD